MYSSFCKLNNSQQGIETTLIFFIFSEISKAKDNSDPVATITNFISSVGSKMIYAPFFIFTIQLFEIFGKVCLDNIKAVGPSCSNAI